MGRSTMCTLLAAVLFIMAIQVAKTSAEPRVFNLRSGEQDDRDQFSVFISIHPTDVVKQYGSSATSDYFRLLELDGDYLIIGAADSMGTGELEREDCIMKSVEQACRNYIRVLNRRDDGDLLICGTNAYKPMCRVVDKHTHKAVIEFSGTGLSPLDPKHNTTFYMDQDYLYAATVADFAGTDSLIFRRNISVGEDRGLRTQRNNAMLLNKPQFVGTLHSDEVIGVMWTLATGTSSTSSKRRTRFKYVYFFFHEEATEAESTSTYSRVARVCKSDKGGPRNYYETEWTSFVKARLNCSIPEKNKPFYFDEIISVSNVTKSRDGRSIVYATFVSEFNFLRHSVICAFDLAQIDRLFEQSDYMAFDGERRKWVRQPRDEKTSKIGQCQPNSRLLSEDEAITVRKFPIMADSIPNVFTASGAVGIHRGSDHYNQIVVLQNVEFHEGLADVLYVATDQGNIIKMINLVGFGNTETGQHSSAKKYYDSVSKLPIRRLLISKNKYLIVVTDPVVYRLPLQMCSAHGSCDECIGSRDPHCVWHDFKCVHLRNVQKKFAYQDVLLRRTKLCAEIELQENKVKEQMAAKLAAVSSVQLSPLDVQLDKYSNFSLDTNRDSNASEKPCHCKDQQLNLNQKCVCSPPKARESLLPAPENPPSASNGQASILSSEYEASSKGPLPWWVLLIIALALLQTIGFLYLCCKLYAKRKRSSSKSCLNKAAKMPRAGLLSKSIGTNGSSQIAAPLNPPRELFISAYSPATILHPANAVSEEKRPGSGAVVYPPSTQWPWIGSQGEHPPRNAKSKSSFISGLLNHSKSEGNGRSDGEISIQLEGCAAPSMPCYASTTTMRTH
uniref:Sema domain-containing protein n=1 Tax=Ditylenchus dipsaci TaxID=166011 RepID=A0A915DLD3_9BILA